MPSVFTINGAPRKSRKPRKKPTGGKPDIGFCKTFKNPRTGRVQETCYVGKGPSSPTGWRIQKSAR